MALTRWPWDLEWSVLAAEPGPAVRSTAFQDGAAREEPAAAFALARYRVRVPGLPSRARFADWAAAHATFLWRGEPARIAGGPGAVVYRQAGRLVQSWSAELTIELLGEEPWTADTAGAVAVEGRAEAALEARAGGAVAVEGRARVVES